MFLIFLRKQEVLCIKIIICVSHKVKYTFYPVSVLKIAVEIDVVLNSRYSMLIAIKLYFKLIIKRF